MSNTQHHVVSRGFPFASILTIIFVIAKLAHVIAWSWWLVFLPIYFSLALFVALVVGGLIFAAIVGVLALVAAFFYTMFSPKYKGKK